MSGFTLTEKQEEARLLFAQAATHILLYGGARSAKTFFIVRQICTRAIASPGSRHSILRFRFNHVKASIVHDTLPKVMNLCFPGYPYRLDKTDWYAQFDNGAQIWFGGLDDKERTEKILGLEYVSIFLNECSQIPFASRNLAVTRLAQKVGYTRGTEEPILLRRKMYYDCNPPSKAHWAYKMFLEKKDPDTGQRLAPATDYASLLMNPRDNLVNLPPDYIETLAGLPARLRKRFLDGEFADVNENALWTSEMIDKWRFAGDELPDMQRVIVAVDPSGVGFNEYAEGDEIGIVVGGLGMDGNAYLLEDLTVKTGPAGWGNIAVSAYDRHQADLIVAEKNFGGAMVKHVIQTAKPGVNCKIVTASRGKSVRAEPIAALSEQGKIRHAGTFHKLEDELCSFIVGGYKGPCSPNRADAFVWCMSELFPGIIKAEKKPVKKSLFSLPGGALGWLNS